MFNKRSRDEGSQALSAYWFSHVYYEVRLSFELSKSNDYFYLIFLIHGSIKEPTS